MSRLFELRLEGSQGQIETNGDRVDTAPFSDAQNDFGFEMNLALSLGQTYFQDIAPAAGLNQRTRGLEKQNGFFGNCVAKFTSMIEIIFSNADNLIHLPTDLS